MKSKLIGALIVSLLMISIATPLFISNTEAIVPNNVIINSDGTITQDNPVIATTDSITYTLQYNYTGTLTIKRNNIIFDGQGNTISGWGTQNGTTLNSVSGITIKNTRYYNFNYSIAMYKVSDITIQNNTIVFDSTTYEDLDGIYGELTTDSTIQANTFEQYSGNYNTGISLNLGSSNNNITNNIIHTNLYCGIIIDGSNSDSKNNNVTNNTVTLCNLGIKFCNSAPYNTASNNNITINDNAFMIDSAENCTIVNNIVTQNNYGVTICRADNNNVTRNTLADNEYGLYFELECRNNTIYANNFWMNSVAAQFQLGTAYPNNWNYSGQGNYWSDYRTTYPSAQESSTPGIWDTPYQIEATIPNTDYYPLVDPIDLYQLNVTEVGHGSTSYSTSLSNDYEFAGVNVTVIAEPATDGEFYNWILDGVNQTSDQTITVNMNSNHNLTAAFKSIAYYLTVQEATNGNITDNEDNIIDGTTIQQPWESQYVVTAVPDSGYLFSHWLINNHSYTGNPAIITFNTNKTLQAVFSPIPTYILSNSSDWPTYLHDNSHSSQTDSIAPTTNQTLWIHEFIDDGSYSTPVVAEGKLYIATGEGYVYAFNTTNGQQIWRTRCNAGTLGADRLDSAPTIYNDIVYGLSYRGFSYAWNATNGQLLWNYSSLGERFYRTSSPTIENGVLYATGEDYIYAFNLTASDESQRLLWQYESGSKFPNSPVISNNKLYAIAGDGKLFALTTDGVQLWNKTLAKCYSSPAISNNILYVTISNGTVNAVNATNGETLWSYDADDPTTATPIVSDGVVYSVANSGKVYALNATSSSPLGELLWEYQLDGDMSFSTPAIADNILYFTTEYGYIYALNSTSQQMLWSYEDEGTCHYSYNSPVIANGVLYALSNSGKETGGIIHAIATHSEVTFTQSSLPDGTNWSVTLSGVTQSSTSDSITFTVCANGPYSYTIATSGYNANVTSGTITVTGNAINNTYTFTKETSPSSSSSGSHSSTTTTSTTPTVTPTPTPTPTTTPTTPTDTEQPTTKEDNSLYLCIGVGAAVLIVVVLLIILLAKRRRLN